MQRLRQQALHSAMYLRAMQAMSVGWTMCRFGEFCTIEGESRSNGPAMIWPNATAGPKQIEASMPLYPLPISAHLMRFIVAVFAGFISWTRSYHSAMEQ